MPLAAGDRQDAIRTVIPEVMYWGYRRMITRASLVQQLFAVGDAGELDWFGALLDENVVVHAPFGLSTEGLEAERESWRQAKAAMPDLRHEFQTVICDGSYESGRCVVTGTLRGEYGGFQAEAAPFRVDQAVFARIRAGKIVELWEIVDTASLVDQLRADGQA
jgi:predicted ester cyclase